MPRKPTNEKISKDAIAQYLTADLDSLTQRAMQYENILSNKINFYLVVVTAAIGGLALTADIPQIKDIFLPIACIVLLLLFIMGWIIFLQGLDLNANSTYMYRRMGRIRQWFVEQEPTLYPYLPFSSGDDKPSFYQKHAPLRTMDSILIVVNAALASTFCALLWLILSLNFFESFFTDTIISSLIAFGLASFTFIVIWVIEFNYSKKFMKAREKTELEGGFIHFPAETIKAKFGNKPRKDKSVE